MTRSLYVHIPFCLKKCIYCDFISGVYDTEKAGTYIDALKKEISNITNITPLSTLYIGGGTPTALSIGLLSDLINHIFHHFRVVESYEATMEVNPGTIGKGKLEAIRSSGINRVSIGIQSFHDHELAFLGRIHTSEEAEKAVHHVKEAGFENIGIDLLYGIPGQSMGSWQSTLRIALSLNPSHISTYALTVEKGTVLHELLKGEITGHPRPAHPPLRGRESREDICIPPSADRRGGGGYNPEPVEEEKGIQMYEYAIDYLTSQGYIQYEISNFALPGHCCRHNLNYWDRGEYHGVGIGAHSFVDGKRSYNTDDLDEYAGRISDNRSPVKESENITEEGALAEAIFLGLRKREGLNVESFLRRYKKNILSYHQEAIKDLQEAGLIEVIHSCHPNERALRLTRKGILLSNEVFGKFI